MTEQGERESEQVTAELFQGFLDESDEMLAEIERGLQALESEPEDLSHIHGIFRAVHSLKGNSSFFDFTNVKTFCHTLENFLDLVRDRRIEMSPEIARFILEGSDHLKAIFNRLHAAHGADVPLTEEEESFLRHVDERVGPQDTEEKLEVLRKSLLKFFGQHQQNGEMEEGAPLREVFELINRNAPFLLEDKRAGAGAPEGRWLLGPVEVTQEFRKLRAIIAEGREGKGQETAGADVLKSVEALAARHTEAGQTEAVEALDALKEEFEIFFQDAVGVDEMLSGIIEQSLAPYAALLTEEKVEERAEERRSLAAAARAEPEGGERRASFVRVDESLLDVFIDHVGELITLSELFNYLQRKLEEKDTRDLALNFKNTNQSFRELASQLQKSLYEIRKAPLESALAKLPRAVRALAKDGGKSIRLAFTGGETEVDKSLLEKVETILMHLVRNCCDHGIETPAERAAAGKPPEGNITITVTSNGVELFLRVADDGRGVNVARVREVAVARGFYSGDAAARLTDREALNILLLPGFSTADKITETSGRGVGMDVLAASVRSLGGALSLQNSPGKGLAIEINVPLMYTTRIKLGLSLAVGDSVFLVPAEHVRETFQPKREEVSTVEGKGEVVMRWGKIYPVARLSRLFGVAPRRENVWDALLVLVESREAAICLMVDEILGQRQIVYKQLTVKTREPNAFEGVSILDGARMALILSVDGVVKQFHEGAGGALPPRRSA